MSDIVSSLADHFLSLSTAHLKKATQHPFLALAGQGELSAERLATWLTQDRLYGLMGYVKLLSGLLAKCPSHDVGPNHPLASQTWRRLHVLGGAMSNITREMTFFEDVAKRNGLSLERAPGARSSEGSSLLGLLAPTTRGYIDYMTSVALTGTFEESLVLLWAMEILYLKAWTFAAETRKESAEWNASKSPAAAALTELIPNWTSPEFHTFVDQIQCLVEGIDEEWRILGSEKLQRLEKVWSTCLWFEERFWDADINWDRSG